MTDLAKMKAALHALRLQLAQATTALNLLSRAVRLQSAESVPDVSEDFDQCVALALQHVRGVTAEDLLSRKRDQRTAGARMLAMWLLRQRKHSLQTIGRAFDRDHSAVMNALRQTEANFPPATLKTLHAA